MKGETVNRNNRWLIFGAALVVVLLLILTGVRVVYGHTPRASLTCEGGLTVVLLKYNGNGTNHVRITMDGEVIVDKDFSEQYGITAQDLDPFVEHIAYVEVTAWDDPTGSKGYTKTYHLQVDPCKETPSESPTPSPTPEVTPSPTPTPSEAPSPTPAPSRTPRPTGPPTDTD